MVQRSRFKTVIEVKWGPCMLGGICGNGAVKSFFVLLPELFINGMPGKSGSGSLGALSFFSQPPVEVFRQRHVEIAQA